MKMISEGRDREGGQLAESPASSQPSCPRAPPAVPGPTSISLTPNGDEQPNAEAIQQLFGFRLPFASEGYPLFSCSLGNSSGYPREEEICFPSPWARAGYSFFYFPASFQRSRLLMRGNQRWFCTANLLLATPRSTAGAIAAHASVCIVYYHPAKYSFFFKKPKLLSQILEATSN